MFGPPTWCLARESGLRCPAPVAGTRAGRDGARLRTLSSWGAQKGLGLGHSSWHPPCPSSVQALGPGGAGRRSGAVPAPPLPACHIDFPPGADLPPRGAGCRAAGPQARLGGARGSHDTPPAFACARLLSPCARDLYPRAAGGRSQQAPLQPAGHADTQAHVPTCMHTHTPVPLSTPQLLTGFCAGSRRNDTWMATPPRPPPAHSPPGRLPAHQRQDPLVRQL